MAYLGGQPVNLTFNLTSVGVKAVSYRVLNQDGVELVAKTAIEPFAEGASSVRVEIAGAVNNLSAGNKREIRMVELYVTNDEGTSKQEREYVIEAEEVLATGVNSFQSYPAALMTALDTPNLPGWNKATKNERTAALIAARRNIGQLRFRHSFDAQNQLTDESVNTSDITTLTPEQYIALPLRFKEALCMAQVIEADYLLEGDEYLELRKKGVMSMTAGESSHFFRTTKPLDGLVCDRAMKVLSKYIVVRKRIGRG